MNTKWLVVYRVRGDYTVLHTVVKERFSDLKEEVARKHGISAVDTAILACVYLPPMHDAISNEVMSILEEYKE